LRALHEAPATAAIPVIVLSSLPQCNAEKLKEAGAVAYIQKSKLDLNSGGHDLVRLLDAALRRKTPRLETATAH
jgi:CheY-like chemotaxis protein